MMVHEGWESKSTIEIPVVQTYTFKVRIRWLSSTKFLKPSSSACPVHHRVLRIWAPL